VEVLPYATVPSLESSRNDQYKRYSLLTILGAFFLAGVCDGISTENNLITFLIGGIIGIASVAWVAADAAQHQRRVGIWLRLVCFGLAPIGFGIYCLMHRRFKMLGIGVLFVLFACLIAGIASEATRHFIA